jgi:hypothetical protein
MNKRILFKVIGVILLSLSVSVLFKLALSIPYTTNSEAFLFIVVGFIALILSIGSFIFSYRYKIRESLSAPLASQSADNIPIIDTMATNNTQVIIPDTCPHCKNPNTKRIRLCEWCGNQIA